MAEIQLNKSSIGGVKTRLSQMQMEVGAARLKVSSAVAGIDFEVASKENIMVRLRKISSSLEKQADYAQSFQKAYIDATNRLIAVDGKFGVQSQNIIDIIRDIGATKGTPGDWAENIWVQLWKQKTKKIFDNTLPWIPEKPIPIVADLDELLRIGAIAGGIGAIAGGIASTATGTAAGSLWNGEASGSSYSNNGDGNIGAGVEGSASGSVWSGDASGSIGIAEGSVGVDVLTGGVRGEARATWMEDGKIRPSLYAGAEAEVSVVHGEAEGSIGTDDLGIGASASGDVLHAEAEGEVGLGYLGTDEDGNAIYGASAKGSAMASVAQGEVEGSINLFGVEISVGATGHVGAIGVEGGASISTEGVSISGGLAFGAGGTVDVNIDWGEAEWIGDTIDAVGDAVEEAGEFFEDVGEFIQSGFNWF